MNARLLALLLAGFALLAGGAAWLRRLDREVKTPIDLTTVAYETSKPCAMCHPGRYESWHRTFHRTMTQSAGPAAVVGNFENASYDYQGVTSRFTREGERYFIETLAPSGSLERFQVVMTVGSRRIQQYVTWLGDRHVRLPLAWDLEEQRWIHLNGGFLDPDSTAWDAHFSTWDNNCVFCHNVKAQPRFDERTGGFAARVAEMGIACEACHGPADEHVKRNSDPLRRYLLYLGGRDPTIHSPKELSRERQIQLCGHCHGQRTPNPPGRLAEFMLAGDPYTAGEDLGTFTAPIDAHTSIAGVDLAARFWKDGTPRLTAYEYQGLLGSAGHEHSKLTCTSCHDMHGGDPRGMIRPAMRGQQGCLQCHGQIGRDVAAHTRHAAASSGSDCYACHMPRTTYGLLAIHPSHRITNPDPSRAWAFDMPEACTLCHTDRPVAWAAREAARQFGRPEPALPHDAAHDNAESVRAMFAGDAVQRAVAIESLTGEASYTGDAAARMWAAPFLLLAMEDRYPAVRHFAARGLLRLCRRAETAWPGVEAASRLPAFDYLADAPVRAAVLRAWWGWWRDLDKAGRVRPGEAVPLDGAWMPIEARVAALKAAQRNEMIAIGE